MTPEEKVQLQREAYRETCRQLYHLLRGASLVAVADFVADLNTERHAAAAFPLRVPRVLKDATGTEWRVVNGHLEMRVGMREDDKTWQHPGPVGVRQDRVLIWAELFTNPTTEAACP